MGVGIKEDEICNVLGREEGAGRGLLRGRCSPQAMPVWGWAGRQGGPEKLVAVSRVSGGPWVEEASPPCPILAGGESVLFPSERRLDSFLDSLSTTALMGRKF